jgi:hypothetical protein
MSDIIYRVNVFFLRVIEPDEMHNNGYFLPEIEEWCKETFGRIPRVYYHEPYGKKYQQFGSGWFVYFKNDAEAIAFKMRWNDWSDLQEFDCR